MTRSMRRDRLTALCNLCGETVKEFFSAVRGLGWNCTDCGYLNKDQVHDIAQREEPTYRDGTPVLWLPPIKTRETVRR